MSHQSSPPPTSSTSRNRFRAILEWFSEIPSDRRWRWVILVFWILVIGVSAPLAGKIGDVEDNGSGAFLPGSSDSLKVANLLDRFDTGNTITAVIVYHRDSALTQDDQAKIAAEQKAMASLSSSFRASPPIPSEDGRAALLTVSLPDTGDSQVTDDVGKIRDQAQKDAPDGLVAKVTGPAGIGVDLGKVFEGINGRLLLSAGIVVAVLLLLTYRSPFLWIIPLAVVGIGDRLATALLYLAARFLDVPANGQSIGIMAVLVFGAGTDYALLLIARYREELHEFEKPSDAMRVAIRQAAPAIAASGGTVMLGLACLLVADLNSNRGLGPTGVIGIFSALILTLTLLPALLMIVGRRVFWPFVPKVGDAKQETTGVWARIGRLVARRPRRVWIGTTIVLLVLSFGVANYSISFSQADQFTDKPEAIQGAELIAQSFPAGASSPTTVIADLPAADAVQAVIGQVPGVANVQESGKTDALVAFSVTLTAEPGTTAAFDTIRDLRSALKNVPDANALVGGSDAENYDTDRAGVRDQEVVIPLVLLVVLIVLCLLLRSILAPVLLLLTSLLSTAAALGVSTLFFTNILGYDGVQPSILLIGFVFLIALGVDYNIFLMSRVHEESPLIGTREGMLKGLAVTGGVITSAGIVLAATFAVLGLLPLVALAQIGFLVSFGVLLDTLIVRSILVPAIALDLGKRIWWPSALSRRDGADV